MIPLPYLEDGSLDLRGDRRAPERPRRARHVAGADVREPQRRHGRRGRGAALVSMPAAAPDFRIFWDNAYAVHHLTDDEQPPIDVLGLAAAAGQPDRSFVFASTSKITLAGRASRSSRPPREHRLVPTARRRADHRTRQGEPVAARALPRLRRRRAAHMRQHRELIAPKFALVERMLTERLTGHGTWTAPLGGYFVTLTAPAGTATRAVDLAKAAGIAVTPAGAAFPYGEDPHDASSGSHRACRRTTTSRPPSRAVRLRAAGGGRARVTPASVARSYWKSRERCCDRPRSGSTRSASRLTTPSAERSRMPRTMSGGRRRAPPGGSRPDAHRADHVDQAVLVFEVEEGDAGCRGRPLPVRHEPGDLDAAPVLGVRSAAAESTPRSASRARKCRSG